MLLLPSRSFCLTALLVLLGVGLQVVEGQASICPKNDFPSSVRAYFTIVTDRTERDCHTKKYPSGEVESRVISSVRNAVKNIKGAGLGFDVLDTCSDPDLAAELVSKYIPLNGRWMTNNNGSICGSKDSNQTTDTHLGFISIAGSEVTLRVAEALSQSDRLFFSAGAISEQNLHAASNAFFLSSSPEDYAEVLIKTALQIGWNCFSVIHSNNRFGLDGVASMKQLAKNHGLCIHYTAPLNSSADVASISQNLADNGNPPAVFYIGDGGMNVVNGLINTISNSDKPKKYWVIVNTFSELPEISENADVLVISPPRASASAQPAASRYWPDLTDAIHLMSEAYDQAVRSESDLDESQLLEIMRNELSKGTVSFTYPGTDRYTNYTASFVNKSVVREPNRRSLAIYIVEKSNKYTEIGDYSRTSFNLTLGRRKQFHCKNDCGGCYSQNLQYTYEPGKYIIIALVPVNTKAEDMNPWKCKPFDPKWVWYGEAARYGLERIGKLTDLNFGLLVLGSCYDSITASKLVSAILTREIEISRHVNGIKRVFDPDSVIGVIGGFSTDVSIGIQNILKHLRITQVSYGSVSAILDDQVAYPYFLRTISSDNKFAPSMLKLVKLLKLDTVQLIYTNSAYGATSAQKLQEVAKNKHVCIAQTILLSDKTDVKEVTQKLLKVGGTGVKAVIYLGEEDSLVNLVKNGLYHNRSKWGELGMTFLASEGWRDKKSMFKTGDHGEFLRGSISFDYGRDNFAILDNRKEKSSDDFMSYLTNRVRKPVANPNNHLFNEWFGKESNKTENCRPTSNDQDPFWISSEKATNNMDLNIQHHTDDINDAAILNMVKAMFAIGYGLKKISQNNVCTGNHNCTKSYLKDSRANIYEAIKTVTIPTKAFPEGDELLPADWPRVFAPGTTMGNVGYTILSVVKTEDADAQTVMVYEPVYTVGVDQKIHLSKKQPIFWKRNGEDYDEIPMLMSRCESSECSSNCLSFEDPSACVKAAQINELMDRFGARERDVTIFFAAVFIITGTSLILLILFGRLLWRIYTYIPGWPEKSDIPAAWNSNIDSIPPNTMQEMRHNANQENNINGRDR